MGTRTSPQNFLRSIYDSVTNPKIVLTYVMYAIYSLFFIFPLLYVFQLSVSPPDSVISYPVEIIPSDITFDPYVSVLTGSPVITWFMNSLKIAVLEVVGIILVATPAAYGFSRFDFRQKRTLLIGVLLFQMISPVVIVIPLYNLMNTLSLLNTHIGLILLYIGLQIPFSVWLLKSYFDTVPNELDEQASIDGCNRLQALWHVLLPAVLPGLAVVVIFNFVFSWAEFVMAFTVLNDSELYTISIGIYSFQGQYSTNWRQIAAVAMIAIVPLILMFIGLQKYFVQGLTEGVGKG